MSNKLRSDIAEIDYYKELFVNSFNPIDLINAGEDIYNGILNLGYKSLSNIEYSTNLDKFNWEMTISENSNTFSLYLLGLRQVFILSYTAQNSGDIKYLELADKFISNFHSYSNKKNNHGMTNNDHALAERIENLIFFFYVGKKLNFNSQNYTILRDVVKLSIEKLFNPKIYQYKHNHGIIADKACLIGTYFLNDEKTESNIRYILNRLKNQIEESFYQDGVHKENSFDYHISTLKLLLCCYQICIKIENPFSHYLYKKISKSLEYIIYGIKPNGSRPLIGDSKAGHNTEKNLFRAPFKPSSFPKNKQYKYVSSFGQTGKPPKELSKYFSQSGYVFLREHFNKENYIDATYLSFKAGYSTRIHKHQDDLSFTLSSKGKDVFIDSGMCGYMPKDKIKDYMESIPAHNTIAIKNKPYSIATANGEKFTILEFDSTNKYDYIKSCSKIYNGTTIYRHIFYLRKFNLFILWDELYSKQKQTYSQYFNLSDDVELLECSSTESVLGIKDSDYSVFLKQLRPTDSVSIFQGKDQPNISVRSTGFGSYEPSTTLEYNKKGHNENFITILNVQNNNKPPPKILLKDSTIIVNQIDIPLNKTTPVEFEGVKMQIKKQHIVEIENLGYLRRNRKYAVYVFNKKDGSIIKKIPYTKKKYIEYDNSEKKDLILLYYISSNEGEAIKGIICEILWVKGKMQITKQYKDLHSPNFKVQPIKKKKKKYIYSLDIIYDYPIIIYWWVYYNGGNINFEINDKRTKSYEFTQKGEYVVMCSVRDKLFGESFFYQFDKIIII